MRKMSEMERLRVAVDQSQPQLVVCGKLVAHLRSGLNSREMSTSPLRLRMKLQQGGPVNSCTVICMLNRTYNAEIMVEWVVWAEVKLQL